MKKIFIALFIFSAITASSQNRIYVNYAATGFNNGTSWDDAYTELRSALEVSQSGDEIWVAAGTYKPYILAFYSFFPKSGTSIYGGFAGNETNLEERDWQQNLTILSGDVGVEGDSTDNSYHIMEFEESGSATLVDGFIFERGGSPNNGFGSGSGGAILVNSSVVETTVIIQNCTFRNNTAEESGGAIYFEPGTSAMAKFTNCNFENNKSHFGGGAILGFMANNSYWHFESCKFVNNRGQSGGAVYIGCVSDSNEIKFSNCEFRNNYAQVEAGALCISISGVEQFELSIDSCQFIGNKSVKTSALSINDNLFFSETYPVRDYRIENCIFSENKNISGGSYMVSLNTIGDASSSTTIKNNVIRDDNENSYLFSLNPPVENFAKNYISGNDIRAKSILIYATKSRYNEVKNNWFEGTGGNRLASFLALTDMKNNVFRSNAALSDNNQLMVDSKVNVCSNNLFSASKPMLPILNFSPDTISYHNSIIDIPFDTALFNNAYYHYLFNNCHFTPSWPVSNTALIYYGSQNIFGSDPVFVDPDTGDYHLQPCSPLIDAGNNIAVETGDTDLDGNPRIYGSKVDIGPYEFTPSFTGVSLQTTPTCAGQQNGSLTVTVPEMCGGVQFSWANSNGTLGSSLENLAAGAYSLTITDAQNQVFTTTFFINELPAPVVNTQTTATGCYVPGGIDVTLSGSNGNPPYTFDWGNNISDTIRFGLASGVYPVTITDGNGCTATSSITINNPDSIAVDAQITPATTPIATNGSIFITPAGGAGNYTVLWNTGDNTLQINDLTVGIYTVTITDANSCSNTFSFEISWAESTSGLEAASINIWPNPVHKSLHVGPPAHLHGFLFSIQGAHGRTVKSITRADNSVFEVSVSDLPAGTYIWQLGNKYRGTFIKQ